jgi:1-acyl-sn-glycerol-3-phosphate acyltransferase
MRSSRRSGGAVRAVVLGGYVIGFWVALPMLLWSAGHAIDRLAGWRLTPWAGGWVVAAAGLGYVAWAMAVLWRHGDGLPVSALPPPRFTRRGPYARARHPIYLGATLVAGGAGLALGSRGLTCVVTPAFVPLWIGYALFEERDLMRRFGSAYRRYRQQVGLFPRPGLYRLTQAAQTLRVLDVQVTGREHVPARGPAVLAYTHGCYLDPGFVGTATRRSVHHLTTAEAYRRGAMRWLVSHFVNIPVRRYRPDPVAMREVLRCLNEGALVGIAVEGERSLLGDYLGAQPDVAGILARLGVPVIPIGLSGNYDAGPRWADRVRRRPVRVRVGPPVDFRGSPGAALDDALRRLLDDDPQPVRLGGLPLDKLQRALWRCPACGSEESWHASCLACEACGVVYTGTPEGWLVDAAGEITSLAALGWRVAAAPEDERLMVAGAVWRERSMYGRIEPLLPVARGPIVLTPDAIVCPGARLPLAGVVRVSTERADTLQVATRETMWQIRLATGSAFRLAAAVARWCGAGVPAGNAA